MSKLIWAVNPLTTNADNLKNAKKLIGLWQKNKKAKILPVSLLTPDDVHLPLSMMVPWGEKLQSLAQNAVKPFLKSQHISHMQEPGVIMGSSKSSGIDDLLAYAKDQKAQWIVTTTHENPTAEKSRISKFTQKLIEKSKIPVMTVRPNTRMPNKISKILYPTDFSTVSKKSYIKAIEAAKRLNAKIILYHNIYEPVLPAAEFTGVSIESAEVLREYSKQFKKSLDQKTEKWIEMAKKHNVQAECVLARANYSLSKAIISAAQNNKAQMIAFGIESHPIMRTILGSTVREVIVSATQPVLILNSKVKN